MSAIVEPSIIEVDGEVCELSPRTFWTCSCGATTTRNGWVPLQAREVCEHCHAAARRLPLPVLNKFILASR